MTSHDSSAGTSAPKSAGTAPLTGGKPKRRLRNFVLQPLLQVKIGLYTIVMSVVFAAAMAYILYYNFNDLVTTIIDLTDAKDDVRELLMDYWSKTRIWIYLCCSVYLFAVVTVSVIMTHRLVGPTVAFRRHVRSLAEGQFHVRTYLRKGDAFIEVAEELNRLSELMEKSRGSRPGAGPSSPKA